MSILRISGIASGLDTEQVVRDLMRIERMKVDKLYQNRQVIEWEKEQFRELINSVRSFRDKYFDILKPETNMMSPSALKRMEAVVTCGDENFDLNGITVTATSDAKAGASTFQVIQSAVAAEASAQGITEGWRTAAEVVSQNLDEANLNFASQGVHDLSLGLSLDGCVIGSIGLTTVQGKDYSETGSSGYDYDALAEDLAADINAAVDLYNGENGADISHVTASNDNGRLIITSGRAGAESEVTLTAGEGTDALASLGFTPGTARGSNEGNRLSLNDTMEVVGGKLKGEYGGFVFDEGDNDRFTLSINGVDIVVNKDDTLGTVINNINNSEAGVRLSYSTFSDTFTVSSRETGEGSITTDNGGCFFSALGMTDAESGEEREIGDVGRDAEFKINGILARRSVNSFTIDGIAYSINREINAGDGSPEVNISINLDVDAAYSSIESFIEDYNSLIEEINGKLQEESFRDFPPLTDEQKKEMSEREIELWEEKAKSGLLRGESSLEKMLMDMRSALYGMVGDLHLTEIGIQTSSNYRERGKLVLKDGGDALKQAIGNNPEKVLEIFTRRSENYEEQGIAYRISGILNDNIRTTRDSNGLKGILLERAGIEGDITQFNNHYDRQILEVNKRIDRMNEMLSRREEQYYRQFTAMEKALQKLYSQGDWLVSQMSQFLS